MKDTAAKPLISIKADNTTEQCINNNGRPQYNVQMY